MVNVEFWKCRGPVLQCSTGLFLIGGVVQRQLRWSTWSGHLMGGVLTGWRAQLALKHLNDLLEFVTLTPTAAAGAGPSNSHVAPLVANKRHTWRKITGFSHSLWPFYHQIPSALTPHSTTTVAPTATRAGANHDCLVGGWTGGDYRRSILVLGWLDWKNNNKSSFYEASWDWSVMKLVGCCCSERWRHKSDSFSFLRPDVCEHLMDDWWWTPPL